MEDNKNDMVEKRGIEEERDIEDKKKKDNTEQPMFMQVLNQPNMIAKGANDENIKKTFAAFSVGGAR